MFSGFSKKEFLETIVVSIGMITAGYILTVGLLSFF